MVQFIKIFCALVFISISVLAQETDVLTLNLKRDNLPFGLHQRVPEKLPKVALVLSGGGARGLSQIGVLKAIEEFNIPVEFIVGTSMGSIVGGLYSAGYSIDELDSIVTVTRWDDFFTPEETSRRELFVEQKITEDRAIFSLRFDGIDPVIPTSINKGQRVSNFLNLLVLNAPLHVNRSFDELVYKFRAVSTDLISGKEIILENGSLSQAMRASSSVSFLLAPVKKDSMLLVDGGLVANTPVIPAKKMDSDIVIAVDVTSPLRGEDELEYPWEVADQLVSIPMQLINKQQLDSADFVVRPELKDFKNSEFININKMIEDGYKAAIIYKDTVRRKILKDFKSQMEEDEYEIHDLKLMPDPTQLESRIYNNLSKYDTLTNKDILFEMYEEFNKGIYKDLYSEISYKNDGSFLKVFHEMNPEIVSYKITGINVVSKHLIYSEIDSLLFKPYNAKKAVQALIRIMRVYRQQGYSLAKIESFYFDEEEGKIYLDINEGVIAEVLIVGNEKTSEEIITREFPLERGDYFNYELAEEGLTNLRSTNLFDDIEINIEKDSAGSNKIILKVQEKLSVLMRFGLRIDNENQAQVSLDLRDENVMGSGTELGAIFSGGTRNRSYAIEHKANRIFETYLTYKIRAFYRFNDVNVYTDDSTGSDKTFSRSQVGEYRQIFSGISVAVGTQVERFGNFIVEAKFQSDEVKNKANYFGETYITNIASLKFSLTIDSQNKYPYPTEGFYINGFYETAQKLLGGKIGFTKSAFDYTGYFSPINDHTVRTRFAIGFADETLPLSQQFSLGGQNQFFGLRDFEYRGRQIFLASAGYRYKLPVSLFFDAYVKVRYDLGSIWSEREQIRFKDLRHGIGATLSFDTPIGPADFSVGRSFIIKNTLPENIISWGPYNIYFTIGYYY